jgi:hypothetical protein
LHFALDCPAQIKSGKKENNINIRPTIELTKITYKQNINNTYNANTQHT